MITDERLKELEDFHRDLAGHHVDEISAWHRDNADALAELIKFRDERKIAYREREAVE